MKLFEVAQTPAETLVSKMASHGVAGVSLMLDDTDVNEVEVLSIKSKDKKSGKATEVMNKLITAADSLQVKLVLVVDVQGDEHDNSQQNVMSAEQLTKWYEKFGFVANGEEMRRNPK